MNTKVQRPLPPGTVIEWNGNEAEVLHDAGGETLDVVHWHDRERWEWVCEGIECTVIKLPTTADAPQLPPSDNLG